jgi:transcriptional regulator with GAF, ATPase, and Fis domain
MVRVNCASIPRELFESEFFGHVKGAFTGAVRDRAGRFRVADQGTLFLDEVGEIPLELQGKLLRVLQEGQFSPVGSDAVNDVDVRVIAATNKDLKAAVAGGTFREDLYYRLNVFPMQLPPLRERKEDIPELAGHFLRMTASRRNDQGLVLRKKDVAALQAYDWPGNIRELQNVIERATILSSSDRLHIELEASGGSLHAAPATLTPEQVRSGVRTEAERTADLARDIRGALAATEGRMSGPGGAADLLGIKPTTLASRMKSLGISRRE